MNDSQADKLEDVLSTLRSAVRDVEDALEDAIGDVEKQAQPDKAQKRLVASLAAMLRGYDNGTWDPVEVAEARRALFELHDAARGYQPYGGLIPMAW